jgi:hypothetical protein
MGVTGMSALPHLLAAVYVGMLVEAISDYLPVVLFAFKKDKKASAALGKCGVFYSSIEAS